MGRLGSGVSLVGRIGLGLRVSASFQIFALRMLLHSARDYLRRIFCRGNAGECPQAPGGLYASLFAINYLIESSKLVI